MWTARKTSRRPAWSGLRSRGPSGPACGRTGARLWSVSGRRAIHRMARGRPQKRVDASLERSLEAVQDPGELLVPLAHQLDLANGVQDRGVVLAAEGPADGRQRFARQ